MTLLAKSVSWSLPPKSQSFPRRPSSRLSPAPAASQSLNFVPTRFSMDEKVSPTASSGQPSPSDQVAPVPSEMLTLRLAAPL